MQGNTQNVPDTLRFFFFFTLSGIYAVDPSSNFCNFTPRLHQKQSQKVRNQKFSCMRGGGGGGGGGIPPVLAVVDHRGCPQWRIQVGFIGFHGTPLL